jgi:prefoldin subunit 5
MASKLDDARKSLIRAQEATNRRLDELDDERREIKASMKSLEAALKALEKPTRRRQIRQNSTATDSAVVDGQ